MQIFISQTWGLDRAKHQICVSFPDTFKLQIIFVHNFQVHSLDDRWGLYFVSGDKDAKSQHSLQLEISYSSDEYIT